MVSPQNTEEPPKFEIEGRLDPYFYNPAFKVPNRELFRTLNEFSRYILHPPEYLREFSDSGIQLIRSQNVRPTGISIDEKPVFFSAEFLEDKKHFFAKKGDVLIVRSGVNAGDVAVIEEDMTNAIIGADTLLCRCAENLIPKFLQVYFFTSFGKAQILKHITGATNTHLNSENLKKVLIPNIALETQRIAISVFEESLEVNRQKKQQAQELLAGIDGYLLAELGITLPEKDNSLEKRIFLVSSNEVFGGRFDPKLYDAITTGLKRAIAKSPLKKLPLHNLIIHSVSGDWGIDVSDEVKDGYQECLVIRSTEFDNKHNLNLDGKRSKYRLIAKDKLRRINVQENDLLIEKSGGSIDQPVGRIALITSECISKESLCFSNFIHKIRVDNKTVQPEYLFNYLKTMHSIKLTDAMQSQTNGIRNLIMHSFFNQKPESVT